MTAATDFRFGDWLVRPASHALQRGDQTVALEPRLMQVLALLCSAPGQVFSADELLQRCWDDAELGDNPVHKCLALLRKALGDSASSPRYIRTLRGQGYCTVAAVEVLDAPAPAQPWTGASPFVGLRAFDARHAPVFCGREASVQLLADSLARQIDKPGPTLLLGASGSGKSSLVQAGLLPRLLRGDASPKLSSQAGLNLDEVVAERWAQEFAAALLDLEQADGQPCFAGHSAESLAALLTQAPGDLDPLQAALAGPGDNLLWLDKFEALLNPAQGLHAVLPEVLALLARLDRCEGLLLLLVCRNDYYPALAQQPWLLASKAWGGHVDLLRPHAAELAQMLRQPAQIAGLRYGVDAQGRRLDDLLLAELQTGADALPLLQHMLAALYERRSAEGELRASDYQQLGGLEGAIAAHAEAVVAQLAQAEQRCLPAVLARLIVVADEAEACTSQAARWRDLGSEAERRLVRALIEARLFTACLVQGEPGFRLSHEALLRRWPRVAEWIAAHLQALRARARLEAGALRWAEQGSRSDQLIPRGRPLEEAEALRAHGLPLSTVLQQHIAASAQRARRQRLQMRALWGSLLLLALAALGLAALARQQAAQAASQRIQAEGLVEFMLGDLRKKLEPVGRLDVLDAVGEQALGYYSAQDLASSDADALGRRARALHLMGEIADKRGKLVEAEQLFTRASGSTAELLARDPQNPQRLFDHAQSSYWVGYAAWRQGKRQVAQPRFEDYLRLAQTLVRLEPAKDAWQMELAWAEHNLGVLLLRSNEAEAALPRFTRARDTWQALLARRPEARQELGSTLGWLAEAEEALGQLDASIASHQAKLALLQPAARAEAVDRKAQDLRGSTLLAMSRLHLAAGRSDQALSLAQSAKDLFQGLAGVDSDNLEALARLSFARLQLAETAMSRGQPALARQELGALAAQMPRFATPGGGHSLRLIKLRGRLLAASLALQQAQAGDAPPAREALAAFLNQHPPNAAEALDGDSRWVLALGALRLGDALPASAAAQPYQQVLDYLHPLGPTSGDPRVAALRAHALLRLGRSAEARGLAERLAASAYRHPEWQAELASRLGLP